MPEQRNSDNRIILVTGATKSGKSEWAEHLATQAEQNAEKANVQKSVIYVATARPQLDDREWQARLDLHRQRRPHHWKTWAVESDLPSIFLGATETDCLLIDSLGTWLANVLEQDDEMWQHNLKTFLQNLRNAKSDVILVAEETGWGVVPAYPLGRLFRDRLGHLIRCVGTIADTVYLVTGGHVLNLSQLGFPLDQHLS
ncbi:bifunctional adenosylcobinamide kinase/adenosylcobinamide-phosphate guanylyltransferase [Myxacorys almedinensis A]|uniref:Adenosylcobinamide kinase n=2 Tax=Myxacorys TaxID=2056239 RepID=A0A8J8CLE7_9CYAN|nr:bifunctional adenosylcobinamide kinase/adenosylcobinamide-phosphate guanylyltransferase [Myxacorys almedinensis]NDJ19551.1 bifunctional adenosylcobinamide kinase/adenosylcobinamide-phosphate guanylyltransferase [Myxacorys almedinensis A]